MRVTTANALDLDALGWPRRGRNPFPFTLELPLPPACSPLTAGETPFIELPRLRPNPLQRQAAETPGAAERHGPPPHNTPEFPDPPPSPSDASDPAGQAEDTAARLDPSSAAEPRAPSGNIISTDGAHFLPGLGPGGSLEAVLQCRLEQIQRWGHTPEKDREQAIAGFLNRITNDVCRDAHGAREHHQARTGLEAVRKYLVKTAALCLAAIDRIDAELASPDMRED